MATMMSLTPEEKWTKMATNYAAMSASMVAISKFHDFTMHDGDTIMCKPKHRFDQKVNECSIQVVAITKEGKTLFSSYPSYEKMAYI